MWTGEVKQRFSCGHHKWMTPLNKQQIKEH